MVALPQFVGESPIEPLGCEQRGQFIIRFYLFEDEDGTEPTPPEMFDGAGADFVVAASWGGVEVARWAHDDLDQDGVVRFGSDASGTYIEVDVPGSVTATLPPGNWVYSWTVYYDDDVDRGDVLVKGPFRVNGHAKAAP